MTNRHAHMFRPCQNWRVYCR
ncbi:hypothetical protein F383_37507 [Gossypium arboreum]|uniref:Uncharacterized protein n=1 Tax=Gossypium arboreum TaxID=29729 RepID=A0A0B0MDF6_GOSAR|nr:hypothetical protein F383_37507 [Gossypium arboreum]